jgi:outer membrane protein assembly factor BamB
MEVSCAESDHRGRHPTSGDVVLFGDMGGIFYALNGETGEKLWGTTLGAAVSGGATTCDTSAGQEVTASSVLTSKIWPTPKSTAKISVLATE